MADIAVTQGVRKGSHIFKGPDGHSYYYNKTMKGGRISLECVCRKWRNVWCRGRASVDSNGCQFRCTQRHTYHNKQHFQTQKFRFAVLSRCRKGDFTSFRQIYNEERRMMPPEIMRSVCANLPFVTIRPAMDRARRTSLPHIPRTLPDLAEMLSSNEHSGLANTLDGEDNIFAASGGDRNEGTAFVIFASKRMLDELAKTKKIFADATFCTPTGLECRQIWNLVKLRKHHIVPMVRVLMQKKNQTTYDLILQKLKDLRPSFRPREAMCDFEDAQINALKAQFPDILIHGCLFHSSKAIAGKAKKLRLGRFVRQNHSANSVTRSMCGLAFLPGNQIESGYKKLKRRAVREHVYNRLKSLFDYFEQYWLRRADILSVYNCPDRTNNACESDNRTLRAALKFKHPSVFCLLKGFLELEDDATQDIAVLDAVNKASRKRRSSVLANDQKIKDLLQELSEKSISCTDFLRRVSRSIQASYNRGFGFDDDFS
ncbi:uncharacterized protein LOC117650856 [Thrips palmi]|uniref:Uncharacterized protein LOC117650856 n=1 Tax=Thrips palmi TaxID=161013 RepID=A0A6P8ZYZ3_THRPL|nr:uncharacterized protein LOC117650856 [Thrips palmi]